MADRPEDALANAGSAIKPQYAQRNMKCYAVTESELKQIGLANLGVTIFFGLGSAFFGFGVDVFKDMQLTPAAPPEAQPLINLVQPGTMVVGIVFWVIALALWVWRWDMLRLIRQESK